MSEASFLSKFKLIFGIIKEFHCVKKIGQNRQNRQKTLKCYFSSIATLEGAPLSKTHNWSDIWLISLNKSLSKLRKTTSWAPSIHFSRILVAFQYSNTRFLLKKWKFATRPKTNFKLNIYYRVWHVVRLDCRHHRCVQFTTMTFILYLKMIFMLVKMDFTSLKY